MISIKKLLKENTNNKNKFYPLNNANLRDEDLMEGIKTILSRQVTMSRKTLEFEKNFKKRLNIKNPIMVNSGSSANLLAFQCLINPYRKKKLKRGDEVIVPAVCWSTSLWPIVQCGLKPVFVDVEKDTFNLSIKDLTKKITRKTKAIILVHVLGNSTNMEELMKIKKKYNLILIEDTCESLGTKYGEKYLGNFGEFSSFSFYFSHQISSIEGGMICCKSNEDAEIIKSLRSHGWSRGLRMQKKIEKKNKKIDKRFLFINSGFNFRPTDVQAAIGNKQFNSLNNFIKIRSLNRKKIIKNLTNDKNWRNQVTFLKENKKVVASWFGIPMLMNPKYKIDKRRILNKLVKNGIENRPIISGNFTKQPSIKKYKLLKRNTSFPNAEYIDKLGFFIGLPVKPLNKNELNKFKVRFFKSFKV